MVENWRRRQFFLFFCVVTGWDYSYFPIVIYNHTESNISRRHHVLVMEHHFKGTWGSFGNDDDEFDRPRGIAVHQMRNVVVPVAVDRIRSVVLMDVVVHLGTFRRRHVVVRQNLTAAVVRRKDVDLKGANLLLSDCATWSNTCSPFQKPDRTVGEKIVAISVTLTISSYEKSQVFTYD